jgi:multidrug efflux pump subunit AcrB
MIFQTDRPDLEIRLQKAEGGRPSVDVARQFVSSVGKRFPAAGIQPVPTENVLRYIANPEQLALYHISYSQLYSRLKEIAGSNKVFGIAAGDQSIPVIICQGTADAAAIMQNTVRNNDGTDIPLQYVVKETKAENFKRLYAGTEGEYYPIVIGSASDKNIKSIVRYAQKLSGQKNLKCSFHGNYYDSRKMIRELAMVLCVALLLLYFILAAQFESLIQPAIILAEIVIDVCIVLLVLWAMGESVNIMSMIGLVVMSGIIINDSILKVDTINRLYRRGGRTSLLRSIIAAGKMRLRPIVMTSLTTILALVPFLNKNDMGSALQFPLSVTIVVGMIVGTAVSLFFIPLLYFIIYRWKEKHSRRQPAA